MPTPTGPVVSVVESGAAAELHLRGAVTIADASELHQAALSLAGRGVDVVACCEGLDRLDAAALQVLVALQKELQAEGSRLTARGAGAGVVAAIRLAGLGGALLAARQP